MTYWRATVERPDGAGGWTVVGVFGTPDTPGHGTARYLYGDTAYDAARLLLTHVWPVNLADFLEREDPGRWRAEREAKTGIADHRITVDVDTTRTWLADSKPAPQTQVFTVAELRLADLRTEVAALADARRKLRELNEQVQRARGDVRHGGYRVQHAKEEAARAGVADADIIKAGRTPRGPRKTPRETA